MSVTVQKERSQSGERFRRIVSGAPLRIVIVVIAFLWTLPTAGLLISSLRPADDINTSGWWTVFAHPFEFSQYT